jgi:hypothetical protein
VFTPAIEPPIVTTPTGKVFQIYFSQSFQEPPCLGARAALAPPALPKNR